MSTSNLPQTFRPYFTPAELAEVIRCLKTAPTTSPTLLRYLESFSLKITHGVMQPQYTAAPSLESRLGMDDSPTVPSIPPAELYELWKVSPAKLLPKQIAAVQQYRYENSLMSPQEETAYVDSIMSGS